MFVLAAIWLFKSFQKLLMSVLLFSWMVAERYCSLIWSWVQLLRHPRRKSDCPGSKDRRFWKLYLCSEKLGGQEKKSHCSCKCWRYDLPMSAHRLRKIIVSISVQYKKFRWKLNTYPAVIISFPKSISFVFLPSFRLLPPPPLSLALKWH